MERKLRTFNVGFDGSYDVDMDMGELISKLQKDKRRLEKEGWTKLHLELDEGVYSDGRHVFLRGTRLETEVEAWRREQQEASQRASREAYERQQYEALRAKFGDKA